HSVIVTRDAFVLRPSSFVVAEAYMLERDPPRQAPNRLPCRLNHARIGIDQREHSLAGRQALLKLTPERRNAGDWVEENPHALYEQIPPPNRHSLVDPQPPAGIHHYRNGNALQSIQQRVDAAEHCHAL